jgi:hypothetical protein
MLEKRLANLTSAAAEPPPLNNADTSPATPQGHKANASLKPLELPYLFL